MSSPLPSECTPPLCSFCETTFCALPTLLYSKSKQCKCLFIPKSATVGHNESHPQEARTDGVNRAKQDANTRRSRQPRRQQPSSANTPNKSSSPSRSPTTQLPLVPFVPSYTLPLIIFFFFWFDFAHLSSRRSPLLFPLAPIVLGL